MIPGSQVVALLTAMVHICTKPTITLIMFEIYTTLEISEIPLHFISTSQRGLFLVPIDCFMMIYDRDTSCALLPLLLISPRSHHDTLWTCNDAFSVLF